MSTTNAQGLVSAGVIVTHNSERFLPALLASIADQTRPLDQLIVIDDRSTDATTSILSEHGIMPTRASSAATDLSTRIAENFAQGVRKTPAGAVVILGDHDDVWRPGRVAHQMHAFEQAPLLAMLASDGEVNEQETLRTTFPIPADWSDMSKAKQFTYALRHSIATGGASAIRPVNLTDIEVPRGWLHDRWWSLAATAQGRMALDTEIVIDYRITPEQQVGLDSANQNAGRLAWLSGHARNAGVSAARGSEIMKLVIRARR